MKNLVQKRLVIVWLLLTLSFYFGSSAMAATNGSVSISGSGGTYTLTDHTGALIIPSPNTISPTNLLYFNSAPAPNAGATAFVPSGFSTYTAAGGFDVSRYDFAGTGTVYVLVRSSDGSHYTILSSGYYNAGGTWTSSPLALSGSEVKDYFLRGQTTRQAATPYAPSSITVQESQVRVGDTTDTRTTLTITVVSDTGSSPNIRDIGGGTPSNYALQIVRSGDGAPVTTVAGGGTVTIAGPTLINQAGGTFTINGDYLEPGETYQIIAWNRNWFSVPGDDNVADLSNKRTVPWTLLGAGMMGGPMEIHCDFNTSGTLGINQFTVPAATAIVFNGPTVTGRTITTMQDLINALADEGITVGTAGWWQETAQIMVGWTDVSGTPIPTGIIGLPSDYTFRSTGPDRVYQMSVSAPISFTLAITR
ncbi:MAG: hypothetical protein JW782_01110 [Candidatus Saganbacteria bacterium]|nr:hypothetical protein [Candidatus Saganbacteria bacterium]